MTGINHALTGALIGSVLPAPAALPLAFLSHFVLDMLPHFGEDFLKRKLLSKSVWAIDISLVLSLLVILSIHGQWLMLLCAIVAISPDFAWVYRFVFVERFGKLQPKSENKFNLFHKNIQKFETRQGLIVDVVWFVAAVLLIRGQL